MLGIDGFKWEEIEVEESVKTHHEDIYIYTQMQNGKQVYRLRIHERTIEKSGLKEGDKLKLYAQGNAIMMLKAEKTGNIDIKPYKGRYAYVGSLSLARKLYTLADALEYECLEAANGYIIFRPIREK